MQINNLSTKILKIIPILNSKRYKGQNGKIGVIGGSFEYTGAPFYAAISSTKGGGDLSAIFCAQQAAIPIKSYSPEIIVHPLLGSDEIDNNEQNIQKILEWLPTLHSLVIGPGLGRSQILEDYLLSIVQNYKGVTVFDADGLWYLVQENNKLMEVVKQRSQNIVLTPNVVEMRRLLNFLKIDEAKQDYESYLQQTKLRDISEVKLNEPLIQNAVQVSQALNNLVIIQKGPVDIITNGKQAYLISKQGSMKRCGGQGDVLSGLTGLYCYWARNSNENKEVSDGLLYGCILSSLITRKAAQLAYDKYYYSLTCPNIIEYIGQAFKEQLASLQQSKL